MTTQPFSITKKIRAIVQFGPPTDMTGLRAGEFYQVTIDPNMASPEGGFIRFDQTFQQNSEIHGWQKIGCLTVLEVLGDAEEYEKIPEGYVVVVDAEVTMSRLTGE